WPTIPWQNFDNDAHVARIEACARELSISAQRAPEGGGFGGRIAQAVRARQQPRLSHVTASATAASDESESFGQRVKRAIERKSGGATKTQTEHQRYVERENERRKTAEGE